MNARSTRFMSDPRRRIGIVAENSRRDAARSAVVASLRRFHAAGRQTSIDAQLAAGRDLAEVATDLLSELSNGDEPVAGGG